MPLVSLSKILSSKAFARNSQLYSSSTTTASTVSVNATDYTAHHSHRHHHHLGLGNPSLKTSRSPSPASSPKKPGGSPKGGVGRTRDRASKSFTFSIDPFNVVASLRTRSSKINAVRPPLPESTLSHPVSAYSGYEDEEYGEPEVDAEEIRRPSGLGRRASLTDMDLSTEVGEEVAGKYDQGSMNEFRTVEKVAEETESRNSISDTSDTESLVEIRYPSGLGKIKIALHPSEIERPLSTYPHFGPGGLYYNDNTHPTDEVALTPWQAPFATTPTPTSPQSPRPTPSPPLSSSSYLSSLLPILTHYLPLHTLTCLARVDRVVGKAARDILWRNIGISVTIRSAQKQNNPNGNNNGSKNKNAKMCMSIDGHGDAKRSHIDTHKLLEVISASTSIGGADADGCAGDVAWLVKSLEMTCRLDSSAPIGLRSSLSQRSRPPPLILVPQGTTTPLRPRNTLPTAGPGLEPGARPPRSEPGLGPVPALAAPLEPRSAPLLSKTIPDPHPVHKDVLAVATTATATPANREQEALTSLQIDVQDVPFSSPRKKINRASLILQNSSLTLRSIAHVKINSTSTSKSNSTSKSKSTSVPDTLQIFTPAAKLRPTSLRLPQSLSLFRSRSVELLGLGHTTAGAPTSQPQPQPLPLLQDSNPITLPSEGTETDTPAPLPPSQLPSRARDSQWTPPPEWDRIVVVTTDSTPHSSLPPSAPLPGTGWSPPSEWQAKPSFPSPPTAFRPTSTSTPATNRTRRPSSSFSASPTPHSLSQSVPFSPSHPSLRLSPSLPSLRALNSPPPPAQSNPPSNCYAEDAPSPSSPVTSVPSPPITPYSAISLSAFPLPPPGVTSHLPLFPPEFSYMFSPESVVSPYPSPPSSLPTRTPTPTLAAGVTAPTTPVSQDEAAESDLPTELAMALKKMVNLEHVTLRYISSSSHRDSGSNSNQSPYVSMRESIDLSLVKKANETLGTVLPSLDSLKSLKVVCQTTQHDEVCRKWWEEATQSLEKFQLDVTCVQD